MSFSSLSIDTTLRLIQSGRTVPLSLQKKNTEIYGSALAWYFKTSICIISQMSANF